MVKRRGSAETSTRKRILDVALGAFGAYGFAGASTRLIADLADVNVALIKYHFGSKEALWKEAADKAFGGVSDALGDTLHDMTDLEPRDRVRVLVRRFVRFTARRPEAVRMLHDEGTHDSERMRWLVDRHLRPVYEALREVIESLQAEGELPADTNHVYFFYIMVGAISAIFHQAPECLYLTGIDARDPAVAEGQTDALIALLLPRSRDARPPARDASSTAPSADAPK